MKISARNQLKGVIAAIKKGAVNSEVTVKIAGKTPIVAIITNNAVKKLGLKAGKNAYAVIKASSVMIAVD